MTAVQLTYGIPDVELQVRGGGAVNPTCFVGHPLVVLFLPSQPERAISELAAYSAQAGELVAHDAWIIAVREEGPELEIPEQVKFEIADDKDGSAWGAFKDSVGSQYQLGRGEGAAFLFGRGGALQRVWPGVGRVGDLVAELRESGFGSESNGAGIAAPMDGLQ